MSLFNINILNDGNIAERDSYNCVYLKDETPYSIQFENNNNVILDAYLKKDDKKLGVYRLIPKEKYLINRPIRRKKELVFLKKTEEYRKDGLYSEKNKNLGKIEVEVKTGVIGINKADLSNKKVFRPESQGYFPEYMNIYKNHIIKNDNIKILSESLPKNDTLPKNETFSDNETCSDEESYPEPNCACPIEKCYNEPEINNSIDDGFTVYGEIKEEKFKTYHQLLYDGNDNKIELFLRCKKSYQKL